ncbi:MAG: FAD-binding oxidoreductase [Pseudomonadota bacterium]
MSTTADVIVIGAGVAGLGAAARIAPDARVLVLEMERTPCFHSSGRSAAIYVKSYGPAAVRAATAASEAFFLEPPDGFADAPLLTPRGFLYVDYESRGVEALLATSPDLEPVTAREAQALFPIIRTEGMTAAAYETDSRNIDVDLLTGGYRRRIAAASGEIVTDAEVSALRRNGDVWRVETRQGAFEAPVVVNAAGAWASRIGSMAGATTVEITPCRRSAAVLPAPEGMDISHWPLVADADESWYAKPLSGKLMVSPADQDPVQACDIHPDDMVLAEGIDRFQRRMNYDVTRMEHSWAGLRSFPPDGEPVVGFDEAAEGFLWYAGIGGYGIQTSPALAKLTGDLIAGRTPSLDGESVALMAPSRFA